MGTNRLSIVQLELSTSTSSVIYHELARTCRPLIINIKLTASSWPIVHHECTGSLGLGIAVWILLLLLHRHLIKVSIRIWWLLAWLLLLIDYCPTGTIIDVKLTWLSGVDAYLELLLADGFLVVEPEIIWASGLVDHEVAGASRAIVDHKLATCAGSIVNGKLIRTTTSVVYHELTAGTGAVVDGELIWATGSVISNKLTSTRQFLLIFSSTHLYKLWLLQIPFILILINKIILWNLRLCLLCSSLLLFIHFIWIRPLGHTVNWFIAVWEFTVLCFGCLLKVLFLQR